MRRMTLSPVASAAMVVAVGAASSVHAATAVFTPIGPNDVEIGETVQFQVTLSVTGLAGFNSADIIIGSNDADDLTFVYDSAWTSAFSSVGPPQYDVGFYDQSAFVGGNNATSVGTSLVLGVVTVHTSGMTAGGHHIDINGTIDGISILGLNGTPESLVGVGFFSVHRPVPAVSTWGLLILFLSLLTVGSCRIRSLSAPLT